MHFGLKQLKTSNRLILIWVDNVLIFEEGSGNELWKSGIIICRFQTCLEILLPYLKPGYLNIKLVFNFFFLWWLDCHNEILKFSPFHTRPFTSTFIPTKKAIFNLHDWRQIPLFSNMAPFFCVRCRKRLCKCIFYSVCICNHCNTLMIQSPSKKG